MVNVINFFNSSLYNATFQNTQLVTEDQGSENILNLTLPVIVGVVAFYYNRENLYLHAQNIYQKYFPSFSKTESIKVGEPNERIDKIINDEFNKHIENDSKERSYAKKGREDYEFPARFYGLTSEGKLQKRFSAKDIVKQKVKKNKNSNQIKILDLGTGTGMFLVELKKEHKSKVDIFGVSANDTRVDLEDDKKEILNERYFLGNIEMLFNIKGIEKSSCDLIFSSFTFMHLCDPLKALINAYNTLKVGGEMHIDHFTLRGIKIEDLRVFLKEHGHEFTLIGKEENIDYFHIVKTKPFLDLPISYVLPPEISDRKWMKYQWLAKS